MGETFGFSYQEQVTHCTEPISITFLELSQDSRCPENVTCVWQGLAQIKLLVSVNGQEKPFDLSTYPPHQGIPSEIVFLGYKIALVDLKPYPNTTKKYRIEDYQAYLLIDKVEE
ncbi:MAG TPA: hypothetical protein DEQ87_00185 [Algoriphagus sp.]|uniref:hypothetical protein n=1 Tax=unclassified Algoriphagus TaxID=2641541 RepID=UPI000C3D73AA|nr:MULTISPECIES: hypothetical protein [unclassified Algoriphagus]MAL13103.1 hypothetical protein [Algoriphagus sp.]MAN87310.1 hypothetical protein [Algoriphagus sp.]QYH41042.1 hypothetical protein GYM62_20390 [Algoriphagus sp. NBT04N3]HAD51480.1 hypothetical protein [Algoriphagus sp.]HAH36311.1 hypothetical protein [Algoriphagus sp.]